MFEFLKKSSVVVSSVNIKWRGATHALGRINVKGKSFDIKIPFQNKPQEDYNLDFLKTQKRPPVVISNISVKQPFRLISVSPSFPINVQEGNKIELNAKIEAPDYAYEGPLEVELISDKSDMVHLEISKIVVRSLNKALEFKDRAQIIDVSKGQVIKQNVHLFGAVEFGAQITKIEVSPPFVFVSSDPRLPFTIDNKTGYLMDIYVQAPYSDYGGTLEIRLS